MVRVPAPFFPHSASLGPAPVPVSAPTTGLDVRFFLSTWCRTSLPLDFLSVLVVRGGAVCLPTPPSWFSKCMCLFFKFQSNTFTHLLGIYTWCHTEYSWNNALESACSRMCSSNPPHLNECHHPLYIGAPNLGTIFDLIPTASPDISTFKTAIGPVHFPTTTII